jgi:hypothetical protein
MKIFDVEFDIDFMDLDTAEAYDEALTAYQKKAARLPKPQNGKLAPIIRAGCELVFEFLDAVLGEGASEEIFQGKCNLDKAIDAMQAIVDEFDRQTKQTIAKAEARKTVPQNRQQRRFEGRKHHKA